LRWERIAVVTDSRVDTHTVNAFPQGKVRIIGGGEAAAACAWIVASEA
jgi:hypothetical protein